MTYLPLHFQLCDTVEVRMQEYPMFRGRWHRFQTGFRNYPSRLDRDRADGILRHKVVGDWVMSYLLVAQEDRVDVILMGIEPVERLPWEKRLLRAAWAGAQAHPVAQGAANAAKEFRRGT